MAEAIILVVSKVGAFALIPLSLKFVEAGAPEPTQAIAEASVRAILAGNDIVECPIEPDRLAAVVAALTTAVQCALPERFAELNER